MRRCVSCGYDGGLLLNGQARRCARCGCDLTQRPARSYAEMEGLLGQPISLSRPLHAPVRRERILQRWLAIVFVALVCMIAIVYLTAAAMML
ncbi:MAG TPA: hypothetical protein VG711_04275 [Phycisphaerales bacterium]|nr:hypothetical protein [Phycisphaerales bacterium]